jgi:hypothetical protein
MYSRFKVLKSDIQAEMVALERIFEALAAMGTDWTDVKDAIAVGYYLHNLYNAFESIFRLVAEAFENHVPDTSRWHSLLLDRMSREIEEVRPRLLSDVAAEALDELRRFRHLFRHLYRYDLEVEGVAKALKQAHRLQAVYLIDLENFIAFLDRLADEESA